MSKVIDFPGAIPGKPIALYTQNHIYSGIVVKREPFPEGNGLWLEDVTVLPIKSQVPASEALRLGSVCVLWNQVVAVGYAPQAYLAEPTEECQQAEYGSHQMLPYQD